MHIDDFSGATGRARAHARTLVSIPVLMAAALLVSPRSSDAQWYVAGYLGASHTLPAPVTIDQPARGTSLTFDDVMFEARPFTSPQYYGVRVGRLFGERRRFGLEFEWLHPKVYSETARAVRITGRLNGVPIDTITRMDEIVQRYSMSHGMNFALFNVVMRLPLAEAGNGIASRVAVTARAGAGPMLPHAESTVNGESADQYEAAGVGYQVAGGVDVRLVGWLSAVADYKFGRATPEITIVDGTGRTTANVHQLAFGLAFGFSR
jgi:hypothetical protein